MSRARQAVVAVALILLGMLAAAAWLGVRALAAQDHLVAARDQLELARTAVTDRQLPQAAAAIDAAAVETSRARSLTGDLVWDLAGVVPWAGVTARNVSGVAAAADDLARQVLPAALEGTRQADPAALRRADGSVDLELLAAVTPAVVTSAQGAAQVAAQLDRLPRDGVVLEVAQARDQLIEQVDQLAATLGGASQALQLAPALLGADRARTYVVVVQQNAESRGTGGLPGGFAVVRADAGRLSVLETGSNAEIADGPVAVPEGVSDDYRARYGILGAFDRWINVNLSPDLPSVARVVAQRFQEQRGLTVDGVAVLDAQGLASLLAGGGPVLLADGTALPADQLVEYLAVGQYADFAPPTGAGVDARTQERKESLALVAAQTASRLVDGRGDPEALLRGLVEAVRSGYLRMASDDPALAGLSEAGVDGALPSTQRPVAYPVVFNSTGGKLDHFLDRSVSYEAQCGGDVRRTRIGVTLTNRAPADGLPPYVTVRQDGRGGVTSSTDNAVTLNVYASAGSVLRRASLDGVTLDPTDPDVPFLTRFLEGGLPAWAVNVELPREQPRTLVLELDEPVLPGEVQIPEQPLSRALAVSVETAACR